MGYLTNYEQEEVRESVRECGRESRGRGRVRMEGVGVRGRVRMEGVGVRGRGREKREIEIYERNRNIWEK
jgi:hypothetical protein